LSRARMHACMHAHTHIQTVVSRFQYISLIAYIYMYTIIKYIPFTFMARQVIGNSKVSIEENLIL